MPFHTFATRGYVTAPTPLEAAPALSKALGDIVRIWIKRDDLLPGAAGGNKTRKLDYALGDALASGCDTVVTCGAPQSNHCRLTLSWCVKENIDCHLVLEERTPGSYDKDGSGNLLLYKLLGAKSVTVVPGGSDMAAAMEAVAAPLRARGAKPRIIPVGASTAVGSLGYARFAFELKQQLDAEKLNIDAIVTPSGSGGTQAGILAGLRLLGVDIPVYGINVGKSTAVQSELVFGITRELCDLLRMPSPVRKSEVICDDRYLGPGYSLPSEAMIEAVSLLASKEAILLDPVYTGKAMAGLISYVRGGKFPHGANVLFLHTGGSPALYAYSHVFK